MTRPDATDAARSLDPRRGPVQLAGRRADRRREHRHRLARHPAQHLVEAFAQRPDLARRSPRSRTRCRRGAHRLLLGNLVARNDPRDGALHRRPRGDVDRRDVFPHETLDALGEIPMIRGLRHARPTRTTRRGPSTPPLNGYSWRTRLIENAVLKIV